MSLFGQKPLLQQPPLGLIPERFYQGASDKERSAEIVEAMMRYAAADKAVPVEWCEELRRRLQSWVPDSRHG